MKLLVLSLLALGSFALEPNEYFQVLTRQVEDEVNNYFEQDFSSTGLTGIFGTGIFGDITNPFELYCPPSNLLHIIQQFLAAFGIDESNPVYQQELSQFQAKINGLSTCLNPVCNYMAGPCRPLFINFTDPCAPAVTSAEISAICDNNCLGTLQATFGGVPGCLAAQGFGPDGGDSGGMMGDMSPFSGLNDLQTTFSAQNVFCTKNPAAVTGGYCMSTIADHTGLADPANPGNATNCDYWRSIGCCVSTFAPIFAAFNGGTCISGPTAADVYAVTQGTAASIIQTCGLQSVPGCPQFGTEVALVSASWLIHNIDLNLYNARSYAQKVRLWAALAHDIAANLNINVNFITVGGFKVPVISVAANDVHADAPVYQPLASDVSADFTVRGDNDATTATTYTALSGFLSGSTTPTFTNLQTEASSQGVATGTVSMSKSQSSASQGVQSGGHSTNGDVKVSPSAVVAFVAAIAAVWVAL